MEFCEYIKEKDTYFLCTKLVENPLLSPLWQKGFISLVLGELDPLAAFSMSSAG